MKGKGRGDRCEENKKERAATDVVAETTRLRCDIALLLKVVGLSAFVSLIKKWRWRTVNIPISNLLSYGILRYILSSLDYTIIYMLIVLSCVYGISQYLPYLFRFVSH